MALPYYVVGMTILDLQNGFPCRILLPEDCGCTNPDLHGYCFCTAHTGGDCLKGAVEIITAGYLDLIIEVRFEGIAFPCVVIFYMEFILCRSLSGMDTRLDNLMLRYSGSAGQYNPITA